MYEGRSFPVDVESSFSLRWGGGAEGIAVDGDGSIHPTADSADEFTMIGSFQASFRRPSSFDVEYVFERGRIVVHGPGNCPSEMTVYEHKDRYGPLVRETQACNFHCLRYERRCSGMDGPTTRDRRVLHT